MTNLRDVVGSILRDMIQAQHEANMYTLSLSDAYSSDVSPASVFPLPAVSLGELEININYAVKKGEDILEDEDYNYAENDRLIARLSAKLSRLIIRKLVSTIQGSDIAYQDNGYSYVDDLGDNLEFADYVAERMYRTLREDVDRLYNEDNTFDIEYIADKVLAIAEQYVLKHSDIAGLFDLPLANTLRATLITVYDHEVSENIRIAVDEVASEDVFSQRRIESLHITIHSDELKEIPTEAIQTLRLRVSPAQIKDKLRS